MHSKLLETLIYARKPAIWWLSNTYIFSTEFTYPQIKQTLKKVIVYVHGGALLIFSSTDLIYQPDFLLEEGVIVVTMNYRLNALGKLQ